MDIMVNGTSVASGWGQGRERTVADNHRTTTWPHYVAEHFSVGEIWNHSLMSKSVELTLRDQYHFCQQYIDSGKDPKDLLCFIELPIPTRLYFEPIAEIHQQYIFPVVMHQNPGLLERRHTLAEFPTFFVSTPVKPAYLSGNPVYQLETSVSGHWVTAHTAEKLNKYSEFSLAVRLDNIREQVSTLQTWLSQNGFDYVMCWISADTSAYAKQLDSRITSKLPCQRSIIRAENFATMTYGNKHSINPDRDHPDGIGQMQISKYLIDFYNKKQQGNNYGQGHS